MGMSKGYVKHADDRSPDITETIQENDAEAAKRWHDDAYIDANGQTRTLHLGDANHAEFVKLKEGFDAKVKAWMNGGGVDGD